MNTQSKSELVDKLYRGIDPFSFFRPDENAIDLQGWGNNHPYLRQSIQRIKPSVVIEIGVWKGGSCFTMADEIRKLSLDAVVLAIDTWRGSAEHWCSDEWFPSLRIAGGVSHIQETFMSNTMAKSLQDIILPLPLDSINAYEVCKKLSIIPDIVHIDAGHDYQSVFNDIRSWWSLLRSGGAMICDDYSKDDSGTPTGFIDVARAVDEHIASSPIAREFEFRENKCIFYKH